MLNIAVVSLIDFTPVSGVTKLDFIGVSKVDFTFDVENIPEGLSSLSFKLKFAGFTENVALSVGSLNFEVCDYFAEGSVKFTFSGTLVSNSQVFYDLLATNSIVSIKANNCKLSSYEMFHNKSQH